MSERKGRLGLRRAGLNLLVGGAVLSGLSCGGDSIEAPTTGSLEVGITTAGPSPDADGYALSIDGGTSQLVAVSSTVQVDDLAPGEHSVRLGDVAGNCSVDGENPRMITVTGGETTPAAFAVSCVPPAPTTGTLTITTATTGPRPDPDGYTATVDGGATHAIGINATLPIAAVAPGSHTVALTGLASNCTLDGTSSRQLSVVAGGDITISFLVDCAALDPRIVFQTDRDGNAEIYRMNPDGSEVVNLTKTNAEEERSPLASPDGQKIAFSVAGGFSVMNADGTGRINLTANSSARLAEWSPDGSKLLFTRGGLYSMDLYSMNADGTGITRLTSTNDATTGGNSHSADATWSPDGQKIAFMSVRDGNQEIYVMNADGSSQRNLTNSAELIHNSEPHWSPDGSKIAFQRLRVYDCCATIGEEYEIWVMNADGTGQTSLAETWSFYQDIRWSPDGHRISYIRDAGGFDQFDLWVMNSDGSGKLNLTNTPMDESAAVWSPDGSRLAYVEGNGSTRDVYVINADGSGRKNISNSPGVDVAPQWAPQ